MDYPDELTERVNLQAFKRRQKVVRDEIGCANEQCFCTGRCRRTAEEEAAHQKFETDFNRIFRAGK